MGFEEDALLQLGAQSGHCKKDTCYCQSTIGANSSLPYFSSLFSFQLEGEMCRTVTGSSFWK